MLEHLPSKTQSLVESAILYGTVGAVFGIIRFIALGRYNNWREAAISWFVSVCVAIIAGNFLTGLGFGDGTAYAASAIGALLSENIVVAFLVLGKQLEQDPLEVVKKLRE